MKYCLLITTCFLVAACASGNYYGDAGKVYTGDKGYVHTKDDSGVWRPVPTGETVKPLPECETPIKDMDKCLDSIQLRQH
jgi:hypothetical protein